MIDIAYHPVHKRSLTLKEGDIDTDGPAPGTGWDKIKDCGAAAIPIAKNSDIRVARLRNGALPAAEVMTEHDGLSLAQCF